MRSGNLSGASIKALIRMKLAGTEGDESESADGSDAKSEGSGKDAKAKKKKDNADDDAGTKSERVLA